MEKNDGYGRSATRDSEKAGVRRSNRTGNWEQSEGNVLWNSLEIWWLVELVGIEPTTSSLRTMRSPS